MTARATNTETDPETAAAAPRARRFFDVWNAGRVVEALDDADPGYTYHDAIFGGPFDKDGHLAMMERILDEIPDRRATIIGAWTVGDVEFVEYVWTGTAGAASVSSEWLAIFEFDRGALRQQRHYRGG